MKPIDQDTAAAIVGITRRRLQQICADGQGPGQSADGRFPPEAFGKWLRERHKSEFGVADDGEAYDFQAERARLTKAQADKVEMELAEMRGELVRAEVVREAWTTWIAACRARLILLPPTIAPRVASGGRIAEVQQIAQDIVYEALNELAGDGLPMGDRSTASGDAEGLAGAPEADHQRVGRRKKATVERIIS